MARRYLAAIFAIAFAGLVLCGPAAGATEPAPAESQAGATDGAAKQEPPPASPFGESQAAERPDATSGVVELSDGSKVPGEIFTTRGQDLTVFDPAKKENRQAPLAAISSIETRVEWERMDQEWRFKEPGSPEKVFTGQSYPNRRYSYVVTLRDGGTLAGYIYGAPLYVRPTGQPRGPQGEPRQFVLHERHKGPAGTDLKSLVYVKAVRFGDDVRKQAEEELRKKAEEEARKVKDPNGGAAAGQKSEKESGPAGGEGAGQTKPEPQAPSEASGGAPEQGAPGKPREDGQ